MTTSHTPALNDAPNEMPSALNLYDSPALKITLGDANPEKLTDFEKFIVECCDVAPHSTLISAFIGVINPRGMLETREYDRFPNENVLTL